MVRLGAVLELLRRILVAIDDRGGWYSTLNAEIRELAEQQIKFIPKNIDLVGMALAAAHQAGAKGDEADVVAMESISRVLTRRPTGGGLLENSKAYLRNTVVPNLVLHLKSKGMSLSQIKRDKTIRSIMDKFNFRDTNLDNYFHGRTKPNKIIKDISQLGIRNTKQRSDVFDSFVKSGSDDFAKFWFIVVKNECRDVLREFRLERNKIITDAVRISPESFDESRHPELAVDERSKAETRMLVEHFKRALKQLNPDYLIVIELMQKKNLDPSNPSHGRKLQDALSLSQQQYSHFLRQFLSDLRQVFHHLDMGYEDAEAVLKAAKVFSFQRRRNLRAWLAHQSSP